MPRKRQTEAERLAHDCPLCGARAGFGCTDYKGEPKPPCVERGRPHVTRAKHERKAAEKNARALKELGGDNTLLTYLHGGADELLAAEGVAKVTADDVAAAKLRAERFKEHSGHAEAALVDGLNWITIHHLRRVAAALIGAEWERILWQGAFGTYRTNLTYIVARYRQILCTTEKVILGYERRFDPARVKVIVHPPNEYRAHPIETRIDGWYAHPTGTWPPDGYVPVMTRDEFDAGFRLHHLHVEPVRDLSDDPAGLFERTIGALRARAAG